MLFQYRRAGQHAARHYTATLSRIDLDDVLQLIEQQKYFVLHAPRQTGKTSVLLALMALLNRGERYRCLYANIKGAQAYRGNVDAALRTVVMQLATAAEVYLGDRRVRTGHWKPCANKAAAACWPRP